jgi:hypothetical protein
MKSSFSPTRPLRPRLSLKFPPLRLRPQNPRTTFRTSASPRKARDLLAAIWKLKALEEAQRPATPDERQARAGFPGFGVVALGIFPDPVTSRSKDAGWQQLGGVSP